MSGTIFLSRSSQDKALALELIAALKAAGFTVLAQDHDIQTGADFTAFMDDALRQAGVTVALLSEPYLASEWCRREARSADAHKDHRLIPLLIEEGCTPDGLLASLVYLNVAGQPAAAVADLIAEVIASGKPVDEAPAARAYLRQSQFVSNLDLHEALFVGRETELARVEEALWRGGGAAAITQSAAVLGQGGVGKTALAHAYARANRHRYRGVWRIQAETSPQEDLAALGVAFAPELATADAPTAVAHALNTIASMPGRPFLLIFDNVTDPAAIQGLRPRAGAHVLITSRWRDWTGHAAPVPLEVLSPEAAQALLAQTAERDTPDEVAALAELLGFLPLALTHAGAALRQNPLLSFAAYAADLKALIESRPKGADYPAPVRAAIESNLAALAQDAPDAPALLHLAAFLAPDAIPLELWDTEAALAQLPERLRPAAARAEGFGLLAQWSLIRINAASQTFSLHRLTQVVVRALLTEAGVRAARAAAAGAAVEGMFPSGDGADNPSDVRSWPRCARLAEHVPVLMSHDAAPARLLNQAGLYFNARTDYVAAEPLMRRALAIDEDSFGPDHPDVAIRLNNLAQLLQDTNRLREAEPLMRRVIAIFETSYGANYPNVATALNNLAQLLQDTNRLGEAEPLMRRALAIDEASFGPDHPVVARDLNNLAQLLQATNRPGEAEPLIRRVIAIFETSYGTNHPNAATALNNLALLLQDTNRLGAAEPLFRRALAIDEASFGPDHPNVARDFNNLATLLQATNRLGEAEPLMRRALAIDEASFGPDHSTVARDLNNLARLLQDMGRLGEAEPLAVRAVAILEAILPEGHPWVVGGRQNLAHIRAALVAPPPAAAESASPLTPNPSPHEGKGLEVRGDWGEVPRPNAPAAGLLAVIEAVVLVGGLLALVALGWG